MFDFQSLLDAVTVVAEKGMASINPATEEVLGYAFDHSVNDLDEAIAKAAIAQKDWAILSYEQRAKILFQAAEKIEESAEALAHLISCEQGKPLNGGARLEAMGASRFLKGAANLKLQPEVVFQNDAVQAVLEYRPIGVVGAISPWNWPVMIAVWQFASALQMGNAVVIKPSEFTPLCVIALVMLVNQVLPANVLTVISGGKEIGARLAKHPQIRKLMFTGSTATGRHIVRASANNLARLTLELGGNDAAIVLPDVNVQEIAQSLFWSTFRNVGQTCGAIKRLYVHDDIYEEICQALVDIAIATPMGNGVDEQNLLGPVTNREQWKIVDYLVEAAKLSGARILHGGNPDRVAKGYFYPVTLVADIEHHHPLVTEEQFGPVLPIIRYQSIEEVIQQANSLSVGLGASVWSADKQYALQIANKLQAGTVTINAHGGPNPLIPFGGTKDSGYGLEFGLEGLKSVALPRVIVS